MQNKEIAVGFLELLTSGKIREAYEKYAAKDFKHHNPYFPGDAASLMHGMEENEKQFPNKIYTVHHVIEDGDVVAVHGHVQLKPGQLEMAVVHIFKIKDGRIAELWDVGQQIPEQSPNQNGMF